MYDEFKKIYERFELKFAFMKELFRDFEDFFNYTVSELSISTQSNWNTKQRILLEIYLKGNNIVQREFENLLYGRIFQNYHRSNLDTAESELTKVSENWLTTNIDNILQRKLSKKRKREAEIIELNLQTYGKQLEELFLLKLYDFQKLLTNQFAFQFITEHLNEKKNAFIKEMNIGGDIVLKSPSNFVHPSDYRAQIKSYIPLRDELKTKRRRIIIEEDNGTEDSGGGDVVYSGENESSSHGDSEDDGGKSYCSDDAADIDSGENESSSHGDSEDDGGKSYCSDDAADIDSGESEASSHGDCEDDGGKSYCRDDAADIDSGENEVRIHGDSGDGGDSSGDDDSGGGGEVGGAPNDARGNELLRSYWKKQDAGDGRNCNNDDGVNTSRGGRDADTSIDTIDVDRKGNKPN